MNLIKLRCHIRILGFSSAGVALFAMLSGRFDAALLGIGMLAISFIAEQILTMEMQRRCKPREKYRVTIDGQTVSRLLTINDAFALAASLTADAFNKRPNRQLIQSLYEVGL